MNHAGALTNYANILFAAGRVDAAIGPARAAVELMLELADAEPARRPALALMLDNYANALTKVGHHTAAPSMRASADLPPPGTRNQSRPDSDVARVLSNYSQRRLAAAGRFTDAAAAGTEAIGSVSATLVI